MNTGSHPGLTGEFEGEVTILQAGADTAIPLNIHFEINDDKVQIFVEGSAYEVALNRNPPAALEITLAPDKAVKLIKCV